LAVHFELYGYTLLELIPAAVLGITFVIQSVYYLAWYGRIATFRQKVGREHPLVSVVVVLENNLFFVQETLPRLLKQDYGAYEIVVVDYGSESEVVDALEVFAGHPRLKTTRVNRDVKYKRRRKLALSVGIKAASYPHILFTEATARPLSVKWLSLMAKGFTAGGLVIGYAGIEARKGLAGRLIRASRLMVSVRYLAAAIRRRAYRGIGANLGFTSKLYFDHKGYNHQRLNTGDDDLFVRQIARRDNTAVILSPKATVRESFHGGLGAWWNERRYATHTYRHYPRGVRAGIFTELFTRALFFAAAVVCIAGMSPYLWIGVVALVVLRWAAVWYVMIRICLRLGEKGLFLALILYDLIAPLTEFSLSLSRKIRPSEGVWS
jgi:glycosyltransferase involved in cell wall biosynthesis